MPQNELAVEEMVRDLWHWAFGNGRIGVEKRVKVLEDLQVHNATLSDVNRIEDKMSERLESMENKIDAIRKNMNINELIKLAVIIGAIVAGARGFFG